MQDSIYNAVSVPIQGKQIAIWYGFHVIQVDVNI